MIIIVWRAIQTKTQEHKHVNIFIKMIIMMRINYWWFHSFLFFSPTFFSSSSLEMNNNYLQDFIPPNSLFPLFSKDKDLNVLLNELDKGLRSQKIHEQYESLLFFSKLINQHPLPVTVNTAFLKLTDLFRVRYVQHHHFISHSKSFFY